MIRSRSLEVLLVVREADNIAPLGQVRRGAEDAPSDIGPVNRSGRLSHQATRAPADALRRA
jgi:hypothetical protein